MDIIKQNFKISHLENPFFCSGLFSDVKVSYIGKSTAEVRHLLINTFFQPGFRDIYIEAARRLLVSLALNPSDYLLQPQPTPRVYEPNAHGTSYHTDFDYGHGESSITFWVPLQMDSISSGFSYIDWERYPDVYQNYEDTLKAGNPIGSLEKWSSPSSINLTDVVAFSSKLLHGSERNQTKDRRVSFDFRVVRKGDLTTSKSIGSYIDLGREYKECRRKHSAVLKYICGGRVISTKVQHLLIESHCSDNGLTVVAQEAEYERYDFPILRSILKGRKSYPGVDAVVISTAAILPEDIQNQISSVGNSAVSVIFAE